MLGRTFEFGHRKATSATTRKLRTRSSSEIPSFRIFWPQTFKDGRLDMFIDLKKASFPCSARAFEIVFPQAGCQAHHGQFVGLWGWTYSSIQCPSCFHGHDQPTNEQMRGVLHTYQIAAKIQNHKTQWHRACVCSESQEPLKNRIYFALWQPSKQHHDYYHCLYFEQHEKLWSCYQYNQMLQK